MSATFFLVVFCCRWGAHYIQYGGFLAFILTLELIVATSMYTYKDRLNEGFEKGLESSMLTYGPDDPQRTIDFYWMQKKVNISPYQKYELSDDSMSPFFPINTSLFYRFTPIFSLNCSHVAAMLRQSRL